MKITTLQQDDLTSRHREILLACLDEYAIHSSSLKTGNLWTLLTRGYLQWESDRWLILTPRGEVTAEKERARRIRLANPEIAVLVKG